MGGGMLVRGGKRGGGATAADGRASPLPNPSSTSTVSYKQCEKSMDTLKSRLKPGRVKKLDLTVLFKLHNFCGWPTGLFQLLVTDEKFRLLVKYRAESVLFLCFSVMCKKSRIFSKCLKTLQLCQTWINSNFMLSLLVKNLNKLDTIPI
jgi:hypothetical protein